MLFLTQTVNSQRQITAIDLNDNKKEYVIHRTAETPPANNPAAPTTANPPPDQDDDEQPPAGGRGQRGGRFGGAAGGGLLSRASRTEAQVVRISSTGDVYLSGSDRAAEPAADGETVPRQDQH